jgi:hypothetical protein
MYGELAHPRLPLAYGELAHPRLPLAYGELAHPRQPLAYGELAQPRQPLAYGGYIVCVFFKFGCGPSIFLCHRQSYTRTTNFQSADSPSPSNSHVST